VTGRRLAAIGGASAIALGAVAACSTSAPPSPSPTAAHAQGATGSTSCTPGQSIACAGPGACAGFQVCANDGLRYEPCQCTSSADAAAPPLDAAPDANDVHVAACRAAEGPTTVPMTAEDTKARMLGRWWPCNGNDSWFLDYPVELTADGKFYQLSYVNGSFVRNLGPSTSGTYVLTGTGPFQLVATWPSFPSEPRTMKIGLEVTPDRLLLDYDSWVRLDGP
jgi:hypothetical protein